MRRVNEPITQIEPEDDELEEEWLRQTDDARTVSADKIADEDSWQVAIWAMEYVRDEPLEGEIRRKVTQALQAVPGVTNAEEQDREQWWVTGTPTGPGLVAAAAQAIDEFADRLEEYLSQS